jgi:hypothetical protein
MLRKTLCSTTLILAFAAASLDQVGVGVVCGQTSPSPAPMQVVKTVDLKPLDGRALKFPNGGVIDRVKLAVDETGDLYMAFSVTTETRTERPIEEPQLVKYDRTGRFISAFALPEFIFARPGGLVYLCSLTVFQSRVYAPVAWRDKANRIRGSILIYTKEGRFDRSTDLPESFVPGKVMALPTGEFYVLGYGPHRGHGYPGSDMILKLSPTGRVMSSFSPFPVDRDSTERFLRSFSQNHLFLDNAGRLIHLLPDATMRVFDLDGRLWETISLPLPGDYLNAVFLRNSVLVFVTFSRASGRTGLTEMDLEGSFISHIAHDVMPIKFGGQDGYYYAITSPSGWSSRNPVLKIVKVRL